MLRNPITGTADCCACAASGHVTAAPPSNVMNSLRFIRSPRRRHFETESPGGRGVDDQLELARLHYRQVSGVGTLQKATGIDAELTPRVRNVGSIAHQSSGFGIVTPGICRGDRVAR